MSSIAAHKIGLKHGNSSTLVIPPDHFFEFSAGQLVGGGAVMYVPIVIGSTTLTNLGAVAEASGQLIGGTTGATSADLAGFGEVKFCLWLETAGVGSVRAAYNLGVGWVALGDAVDLASAAGVKATAWAELAAPARAPVLLAARAWNGNGAADPVVRALGIMVR